MCGIAGCYGNQDIQTIKQMLAALSFRLPHEEDLFTGKDLAWGQSRQKANGNQGDQQPLASADRSQSLIATGKIYNFEKIRQRLEQHYPFQTDSDAEVILALYAERGPDGVRDLDGIFAFALFDDRRNTFMLARDPLGVKPLYYGFQGESIYFSTDLEAMEMTGVEEIHDFPPGYYYTPADGFICYYRLPQVDKIPLEARKATGLRIHDSFKRAVGKCLLGPEQKTVGAFVSGGVNSALVAAVAAQETKELHTFSVGMRQESDQAPANILAARMLAEHIGSHHHELLFSKDDYLHALRQVIAKLKSFDPILVRYAVPYYLSSHLAAEHVEVALAGEGADALFAGYHYMQKLPASSINEEGRRCIANLHSLDVQGAERMASYFDLEVRLPFLDKDLISLAMKIPAEMKIRLQDDGRRMDKWILRQAFADTNLIPAEILWGNTPGNPMGGDYRQLGKEVAEEQVSSTDMKRLQEANPEAILSTKEAALYYTIFTELQGA